MKNKIKNKENVTQKKSNGYINVILIIIFKKIYKTLLQKKNNLLCKLDYPFNDNPNSFEDLSPVIVGDGNIYIDSLLWALKNKNVKNIALTGSYGSGKSSILKTFIEKHSEFEYLNISLATFDDLFEVEEEPLPKQKTAKYDEMNKRIELSILQQMLYVEKSNTIPNSRFQKIKNLKNHSIFFNSIFCLIIVLSYIFLFHNNLITRLNCFKFYFFESENCEFNFEFFEILSIIFLLIGAFYIIKNFVKAVSDFKFSKINFKGDVELNREVADNSILNKNLDEIIYFFERTNYNVVIIEDLDRFNEPEIFTKLREINLLLNISKQVNRHIVFIYALKDEMFKNGDRTKFFDFILPIIPIINSSNSYNFLAEKLKTENIDKNLLYDISLYIDDMRLLKNIINEYKIYHDKLTKETKIRLIPNKLLSFIIYKNLFPKDFALLHKNEGMIYEAFNKDLKVIKEEQTEIEDKKNTQYNNEILRLKELVDDKTKINNVNDLRRLYVLEFLKELPDETTSFTFNDNKYFLNQVEDLIEDEVFNNFKNIQTISLSHKTILNWALSEKLTEKNINFKRIEKKVDPNYSYDQRVELIFEKENKEIEKLKDLVQISKEEINKIREYTFQQILTKHKNCGQHLNIEIKKSDVLIYFISNGFIAEDYFDYISIFKEGDITRSDKNFILSIRNSNALPVDFKLDKIENLLKHLVKDLDKNEILNIELIDYILEKKNKNFTKIFAQFSDENERTIEFLERYIKIGKHFDRFVNEICLKYPNFWSYVEDNNFTDEDKNFIFKNLLINVDFNLLKDQNKEGRFSSYISKKADFLNIIDFENKNVENVLLNLDVKFEIPLLDVQSNPKLFDFIYKNNLYQLNNDMIEQIIIEQTLSKNNVLNLRVANYTTIQELELVNLMEYVDNEILYYINNVYLKLGTNKSENEKYLINLLNNPKLVSVDPYDIIENQDVIFNKLDEIKNPKSWISLFALNKIKPIWLNVFKYYEEHNFDEFLIYFLNNEKEYIELSKSDIKSLDFAKEAKDEFVIDLILTNEISNIAYPFLIENIEDSYDNLNINGLEEEKIKMLVEEGIIPLTKENFELLRINSLDKQILLIKLNFDKYIEQRDEEEINYELKEKEYESLLNSDLSVENKIELILELEEDEIHEKNNLGNLVGEVLKNRKLNTLSFSFFVNLLKNIHSTETKIKLCNLYFDLFSQSFTSIEEVLTIVDQPFVNIIKVGTNKPPINYNEENLQLIENLKKARYIISYTLKNGKITKIRRI